jgi:hypothetical protein
MLNRNKLIEDIADSAIDSIDLKDLMNYYRDSQIEYMESLTDMELLEHADIYLYDFVEEDYEEEYL